MRLREISRQGMSIQEKLSIPSEATRAKISLLGTEYDIPLTEEVLSKHILFSGAIGSGKTTAMNGLLDTIIRTMNTDDVMIVFDSKGDFRKRFYRPGRDAIISCTGETTVKWNMFREIEVDGPEKIESNLSELVNSLFDEKIKRSNAPFFPMAAKDILFGIMMYIYRKTEKVERHNRELYAYLRDATLEDVVDSFDVMDDLRGLIDYLSGPTGMSEQSQGVYSELRLLSREVLKENFREKGDFSIREFVRRKGGRILFVEYDLGIGSVVTPVYKTLYDLAIKEALCRSRSEGNVYFVIDEFSLLPHLYHIADGVNFGRSMGAKFIVSIQNCQQVMEAYGQYNALSILSAFGTMISFKNSDKSTIEFIQEHYGTARMALSYDTRDSREGSKDTYITGKAVEDYDVLFLKKGEALVSVPDYSPYPARFVFRNPDIKR